MCPPPLHGEGDCGGIAGSRRTGRPPAGAFLVGDKGGTAWAVGGVGSGMEGWVR